MKLVCQALQNYQMVREQAYSFAMLTLFCNTALCIAISASVQLRYRAGTQPPKPESLKRTLLLD
jgi:hypothetical protein